ncbi:TOMM precursor leader peptide-binding protein [Alicyclobacillus mengziensis]|uniref:TOMM leader peptide-binding protein n=1 Tax=Alicyclobacillus mengziensis TaxID=2931921 RepID=A0A9X7VUL1_9BACL|nr:TOMM precursor leader peptide-binding protein [Alicyclobacillus mengziensis]QSO45456.1 TOMM precursor leader peptide-binding protein [Alicyclobacillus mengziensis]
MDNHKWRVWIVGVGQITEALKTSFASAGFKVLFGNDVCEFEVERLPNLVVVSLDDWNPNQTKSNLEACHKLQVPVVEFIGISNTVLFGPLRTFSLPGCTECTRIRWERSVQRFAWTRQIRELAQDRRVRVPLRASMHALCVFADMVVPEIASALDSSVSPVLDSVGVYNTATETLQWKPLLPSHQCKNCVVREDDTASRARVHLVSHHIRDESRLRSREIPSEELMRQYVDTDVGLVSELKTFHRTSHTTVSACVVRDDLSLSFGAGHALSEESATAIAILESMERFCGREPLGKRTKLYDSFTNRREYAIHPRELGEHDDDLFEHSELGFTRFVEDDKYRWVWAHSFARNDAILVPEQIAYFGAVKRGEPRFVYETSSGCAVGGTLEDAILHAILEVIERDLFLNMWYGKIPLPELLLGPTCPPDVQTWYSMVVAQGFSVRLFDVSLDLELPAVLAVAVNHHNTAPKTLMAAGCHLHPYQAVESALRELAVQTASLSNLSTDKLERAREMYTNSSKVMKMRDHVLVNCLPESFERLSFIFQHQSESISVEEAFGGSYTDKFGFISKDIKVVLESLLSYLLGQGFDVLVVDETSIELQTMGLSCVKVLIPGMLPMTFGHKRRRIKGLTRVLSLPFRLGVASGPLSEDELNLYPHPFP